jgi:thiosulfate/3-mercaptopyruvate sulfurtransferase
VVLADVRWYADGRSGREEYETGHIPGAVFVDLEQRLSGEDPLGGRHPLPAPEAFAGGMAALGIGERDTVIAYDDAGGVIAARLVWMLRATGHSSALLDGGLAIYPGELEREETRRPAALFTARPWPSNRLATIDDAASDNFTLLDARPHERYRGQADSLDPRAGHIPGAESLPCRENLDATGQALSIERLRERLTALGVVRGEQVVSYCGSGVTACHNLLMIERCGLGHGRLYAGSWSQWSRDPSRAIATGENPTGAPRC